MNEKTVWESYTEEDKKKVYDFCEEYRTFLFKCKTERECVKEILKEAEVKGYRSLKEVRRSGEKLQAGDKFMFPSWEKHWHCSISEKNLWKRA